MDAEQQAIPEMMGGGMRVGGSLRPGVIMVWGIFVAELLLLLIAELPGVADFQKFAFYDEGSWLRMDRLFAAAGGGKIPTVDFGYSYGMLPLILGRGWFACFGRGAWAFIGFITACNVGAAWGMARILEAVSESRGGGGGKGVGVAWRWVGLSCVLLPYAIFPGNYSLMHALEMMLIVLSLAQQARGKYGGALAFAVLAVLTKPTMGYVLGFLLLVWGWRMRAGWKIVIAPVVVGVVGMALELCTVGVLPLIHNLLPLTGGKSYAAMNFGFFHAGRDFWLHSEGGILGTLGYYFLSPPAMWLVGTVLVWGAACFALRGHTRRVAAALKGGDAGLTRSDLEKNSDALLVTVAILHAAFVFLFYAWAGSWTYYSYLWVIGLLVVMARGLGVGWMGKRKVAAGVLAAVAALGLSGKFSESWGRWTGMAREANTQGLWTYPEFVEDAEKARGMVKGNAALFLVNGDLAGFWPEARVPAVWFLSPGIQTPAEIAAIRKQMDAAEMIVTCKDYDPLQEAWNWPEFAAERNAFEQTWVGRDFVVWQRKRSGAESAPAGG